MSEPTFSFTPTCPRCGPSSFIANSRKPDGGPPVIDLECERCGGRTKITLDPKEGITQRGVPRLVPPPKEPK